MEYLDIKEEVIKLGVDDVRFLNLRDYHSPRSPSPSKYLTDAKSLVVFLLRELRGSYMNRSIIKMYGMWSLDFTLRDIGYRIARYIEDEFDTDALMIPDHRPFEIEEKTMKSIIAPISLRHAAVQCGLGIMGKNNLVVTPRWGSMVRIGAVLTNLPLKSDFPLDYSPCDTCNYSCTEKCPVQAIEGERVNQRLCTGYSQPYDVGNYMRFMRKWEDLTSEERKDFMLTPHWFNLYMAGMGYMYYRCTECTRGCPGEKQRSMYRSESTMVGYATTLENPKVMSIENPLVRK